MKPIKGSKVESLDIEDFKLELQDMKDQLNEMIKNDSEYNGEADLLLETIKNVQNGLQGVNNFDSMPASQQARILADMALLGTMIASMCDEDGDADCDLDYFEFLDEEEDEDSLVFFPEKS